MSELIQQSYAGVKKSKDVKDVKDGKYNLIGPNDQVILPQLWERLVEPGWEISMKMWQTQYSIKFMDAVGRKFSFPFELCHTWAVSCHLLHPF